MVVSLPCEVRLRVTAIEQLRNLSHTYEAVLFPVGFWQRFRALREFTYPIGRAKRDLGSNVFEDYDCSRGSEKLWWLSSRSLAPCSAAVQSCQYDRVIPGRLAGAYIHAFVDPCAENFDTERFVRQQGLHHESEKSIRVKLVDGTSISTLGSIILPWQLRGEKCHSLIRFHVIPTLYSHYPAIVGGAYLWESGALTVHSDRVRLQSRKKSNPRIHFQGRGHLRLEGTCENFEAVIFPDLASDIPAMSTDFAYRIGKDVDTSPSARICLEMPGGRQTTTRGRVTDVRLQLSDEIYRQTFYLIDGLPGDILLDAAFLTRTHAFTKHQSVVTVTAPNGDDDDDGVFLVVFAKQKCETNVKEGQKLTRQMKLLGIDATCDSACDALDKRQEKIDKELGREADPVVRNYLESKLVGIKAERDENFAARDRLYQMLVAEPLQETTPSDPVAKKPRRIFSQWAGKLLTRRRQSKDLVLPPDVV